MKLTLSFVNIASKAKMTRIISNLILFREIVNRTANVSYQATGIGLNCCALSLVHERVNHLHYIIHTFIRI